MAQYALKAKLVDALASRSETENAWSKRLAGIKTTKDFNYTSIYDYSPKPKADNNDPQIAVIFADRCDQRR